MNAVNAGADQEIKDLYGSLEKMTKENTSSETSITGNTQLISSVQKQISNQIKDHEHLKEKLS